ncbi:MAG: hypothetical protein HC849_12890 [Oscillatoriales cyanobacterium RU_3_3]|nr:hypothetical protein [Oscillatoriales cyanobacterium RU_3_3]NJR24584.1 hypothetical protein [Richelia sp. CSU_2_1]
MKEKKLLLACWLIGASLTGAINSGSIAKVAIDRSYTRSPNSLAQTQDLSKATLTLQDLPPGFTREVSQEENFKNMLNQKQRGFKPETVFAFQNIVQQKYFQLVLGFTVLAPGELDRAGFDAVLSEYNFAEKLTAALKDGNSANLGKVTTLPLPDNLGKFSAGWTVRGTMQGIPVRMDVGIFGRGKLVAALLTLYVEGNNSIVPIEGLARKLDDRLIELMPPTSTEPQ